jgi:hypothetical protein
MLKIRTIMNSPLEDIFGFKCCYGVLTYDQNLEIHLENTSNRTVVVPSYVDLKGKYGTLRIDNLMPAGDLSIEPFDVRAFYCYMDDDVWSATRELVFYDTAGKAYRSEVRQSSGEQI